MGVLCLNLEKVRNSKIGQYVSELPSWAQLSLLLLYAKQLQEQPKIDNEDDDFTFLQRTLSTLNLQPNSPLLWDDDIRTDLLQGTQALEVAEGYLSYLKAEWEMSIQAVVQKIPKSLLPNGVEFEDLKWAFCVTRANSFAPLDTQETLTMVGLAGLFEHSRTNSASLKVKSGGNIFGIGGNAGSKVSIVSNADFTEGELVKLNFAPSLTESQLLVNYGVSDPNYGVEAVELKLSITEDDRFFGDKADTLEQEGMALSQSFLMKSDEDPTETMQAFMRLCLLKDKDAFILEPIFRDDLWKEHMTLPFSENNEEEMCNAMIQWAQNRLAGFSSPLEENLAVRESGRLFPGSREEEALAIRIGEQKVVEAPVLAVV
eukprot:jgi/Bigna1/85686/estExt_fgenesh1_pg.C_50226